MKKKNQFVVEITTPWNGNSFLEGPFATSEAAAVHAEEVRASDFRLEVRRRQILIPVETEGK